MADRWPTESGSPALRLFGGVELTGPMGVTSLTGAKQRALVARLAIDAGHAVSPEQLVDSVWGEDAPPTVRASIQVHVSRVRKALAEVGLDDVLVSRVGGYSLEIDHASVDVYRFEQLAGAATAAAQSGDDEQALDLALEALDLWRGPPLAGVGEAPFVGPLTARLSGIRLELLSVAATGSIAAQRVGDVLATVESLVVEHPYAEPLWASLARLLYAHGRQADALERLAIVRRALREDLGLEPSLEITELERQILVHDPTLSPDPTPNRKAAGATVGSNLPLLRSLIGRDELIADVARRVNQGSLVTLTGPGGVGKTSIAAHVATQVGSTHRDGVCFVDLTAVAPGQDLTPALTAAIGMVAPRALTLDDIAEALATRDQLLVLDNCEHVLESSAELVRALVARTSLAVLTTSREPLGVVEEIVVDIPPLSATDGADLFIRRAQASVSSFVLAPEEAADVARIVELVDGLPLALELASPLLRMLSPREIAQELTHDRTLAPTVRSGEQRHSSMDNAVAWSYNLLDTPARALFERFAVFEGGTDLSGVIEVCGDVGDGRLPAGLVRDALQSLVARSLLAVERTSSGTRYRMLVPVHAFAKRMLESSGEKPQLRRRHVRHVIDWLAANARVIEGEDPRPGLEGFERAAANVRAAHDWCRETGDHAAAAEVLAAISTLAFRQVTAIPEVTPWIRAALRVPGLPAVTRLRVLLVAALVLDEPQAQALRRSQEAVELAQQLGDVRSTLLATLAVAHATAESDVSAAIDIVANELRPSFPPDRMISSVVEGMALTYLCNYLLRAGRHSEAEKWLSERLAFGTRRFGLYEGEILYQSGRLALQLGDLVTAEQIFRAADEAARRTGALCGHSFALFGLARLALDRDDLDRALQLFEETLELDLLADPRETWSERMYAGVIACRLGRVELAAAHLAALHDDGRPIVSQTRNLLAGCLAAANGALEVADRSFAAAARQAAEMGSCTFLALVYEEWARYTSDAAVAESLRVLSAQLRSGSLKVTDAEVARAGYDT